MADIVLIMHSTSDRLSAQVRCNCGGPVVNCDGAPLLIHYSYHCCPTSSDDRPARAHPGLERYRHAATVTTLEAEGHV